MARHESTDDVKGWFAGAIAKLWPVAEGSISLRHCPCIRKNCAVCARGRGHASYVLYARKGERRTSIYVPHELASKLAGAIKNGRRLQQLINEAGIRYAQALKRERARKLDRRVAVKT
jgi:hypothetical protein